MRRFYNLLRDTHSPGQGRHEDLESVKKKGLSLSYLSMRRYRQEKGEQKQLGKHMEVQGSTPSSVFWIDCSLKKNPNSR